MLVCRTLLQNGTVGGAAGHRARPQIQSGQKGKARCLNGLSPHILCTHWASYFPSLTFSFASVKICKLYL